MLLIAQDGCPTIRVFNEIPPYIDTNAPPLRTPERQRFEPSCSPPIAGYPGRYQSGIKMICLRTGIRDSNVSYMDLIL